MSVIPAIAPEEQALAFYRQIKSQIGPDGESDLAENWPFFMQYLAKSRFATEARLRVSLNTHYARLHGLASDDFLQISKVQLDIQKISIALRTLDLRYQPNLENWRMYKFRLNNPRLNQPAVQIQHQAIDNLPQKPL